MYLELERVKLNEVSCSVLPLSSLMTTLYSFVPAPAITPAFAASCIRTAAPSAWVEVPRIVPESSIVPLSRYQTAASVPVSAVVAEPDGKMKSPYAPPFVAAEVVLEPEVSQPARPADVLESPAF